MRWSIRNQILVPLLAMQGLAIAATTAATAGLAARLGERRVEERLDGVLDTLAQGNFPATDAVLGRMHGLSGAHFLALGPDGRPTAESRPGLARVAGRGTVDPPASATVDGEVYRVALADRSPAAGPLVVFYPESDLRRARLEAALPPLAMGGAALLLLAAWTGWTADRIARRLRRVEQSIARTAAGEPGPVEVGGPDDEVRELARTVDRMAEDLRRLHDRIRLAERERVLARIAAGLAHQLRNALTGARVSLQLHARRSPACAAEPALGVALRQLDLTEEQIRGLLAAGRGPEHQGEAGPASCDLRRVAREVVALVGPSAEHARVALAPPAGEGPVEVAARPGEARAALLNLVQNAVEAAGQGGAVEIAVGDEGSVEILDTGTGPPAELAGRLFEPFVSGKAEGVGLGLALARRVAEAAGGRLSWERRGGRTCFRLELPRAGGEAG